MLAYVGASGFRANLSRSCFSAFQKKKNVAGDVNLGTKTGFVLSIFGEQLLDCPLM